MSSTCKMLCQTDGSSTLSTGLLLLREENEDRPVGTTTTHRVTSLPEATRPAKIIVAGQLIDYNDERPHSSLAYLTPKEFAEGPGVNPTPQLSVA
jgi:transposase InsO family protein